MGIIKKKAKRPSSEEAVFSFPLPLNLDKTLNKSKLTVKTQKVPPSTPVYSYHWINLILLANPFPRLSQVHDISALR